MHEVTSQLTEEFGPAVPAEVVRRTVADSFESFSDSRISGFVPILARRHARERLRRYARPA